MKLLRSKEESGLVEWDAMQCSGMGWIVACLVWCGVVWCGVVWCGVGALWYCVLHGAVLYRTLVYCNESSAVLCSAAQ